MSELTVEQLWNRAHEQVRRGEFASAVRDLAQCFQMLQATGDARVYEVHKRWTEVHQMYVEDGQRQSQPPAAAQKAPSIEAEAEAAANAGDLDRAIALYQQAAAQAPNNELVRERLSELTLAKKRADELSKPRPASPSSRRDAAESSSVAAPRTAAPTDTPPVTPRPVSTPPAPVATATTPAPPPPATTTASRSESDWSDIGEQAAAAEEAASAAAPAAEATAAAAAATPNAQRAPETAPTMAVADAPVGMQSLDVAISVGESIDSFEADELPVAGAVSAPPTSSSTTSADVALLEDLLARLRRNRRKSA